MGFFAQGCFTVCLWISGLECCSSTDPLCVRSFDIDRWLGYLTLLLFDVLICLLVLFGLIRNSRGTLIG